MFRVQVFANVLRGNMLLKEWREQISSLRFSTNAMTGFSDCTFVLKAHYNNLYDIVVGTSQQPTFITNRVKILDPDGVTVYQGLIYDLNLVYGNATVSRSASSLSTVARMDYQRKRPQGDTDEIECFRNDNKRALFGTRVYHEELSGTFASNVVPAQMARRFITRHKTPGRSSSKTLGGSGSELSLTVSCVGLAETLNVRYAWNASAVPIDTSEIVKDMIRSGAISSGNGSGIGRNGWHERLTSTSDTSNNVPFAAEFIRSGFNNVEPSGVLISPTLVQGQTRLGIIRAAAAYGSSDFKRMLFQVWEAASDTQGLGIPYFVKQPTRRSGEANYTGYYDDALRGFMYDAAQRRVPLWRVRAGQWTASIDLASQTYGAIEDVFDDPKMFWIEESSYDVDNATLTLTSGGEFSLERYVGERIGRTRVIQAEEA